MCVWSPPLHGRLCVHGQALRVAAASGTSQPPPTARSVGGRSAASWAVSRLWEPLGLSAPPRPPPNFWCRGGWLSAGPLCGFHTVFVPGCGQQRRRGGANGAGGGRRPRTGRGGGWCRVPAARPVPIALHVPANRSPAGCAAPPALPPCSATPRTCSGRGGAGRGGPRAQACAGPGCSPRAGAFPRAGRGAAGRGGGCPLPGCSGDQAASSGEGGVPRRGGAVLAEEAGLPCVKPSPPAPSQVGWEPAGLPRVVCSPPHPGLPPSVRAGVWRGQEAQGRSWCCSCVPPPCPEGCQQQPRHGTAQPPRMRRSGGQQLAPAAAPAWEGTEEPRRGEGVMRLALEGWLTSCPGALEGWRFLSKALTDPATAGVCVGAGGAEA